MFENLLLAREGALAFVTINRPQVLNALDSRTLDELRDAMLALGGDTAVRAVVVTGAGDKAFAAGADIRELTTLSPAAAHAHALRGQRTFDVIEQLGKPVVAAVNGFALGGGCELAIACTLRIAAEHARFGQPEINLGLTPGFAGTQRLPRLVGRGVALEMLLTGRQVTAAEAQAYGLVNRVVPAADLPAAARAVAEELAGKAPLTVGYILDAVHRGGGMPFEQGQRLEAALFGLAASTADMREGTSAFLARRPPVFKGE